MISLASLRRRIVLGVVCFTILITLATTWLGYWFDEQAEQRVWATMFHGGLARRLAGTPRENGDGSDSLPFLAFGEKFGKPLPEPLSRLEPGIHDDVHIGDRTYVIDVGQGEVGPEVLALDISDMAHDESNLDMELFFSAVVAVLLLLAVTYLGARWLTMPLMRLSTVIGRFRPGVKGQQVAIRASDPLEVVVISRAINTYLHAIDGHVERERQFLDMASHELRTPLAVISGAAEVAIEQSTMDQARVHIHRIVEASRAMRDLVVLLLALARDLPRLRADVERIDLAQLLPRIVADHEHLTIGKDLTIVCENMPPTPLSVNRSIAMAVIGNLVRNAIENSSRGTIHIHMHGAETLVLADPGSGMSSDETRELRTRWARAGQGRSDGIGLGLVLRLCEHVGWTLTLDVGASTGTIASLSFAPRHPPVSPSCGSLP